MARNIIASPSTPLKGKPKGGMKVKAPKMSKSYK